ncbi:hypothetical protein [Francisella philomiragia]|nr:hypothetical protein [Francisella philomiragia]MBK2268363.1 hypothetical protein [Francisella philomiragia]MBK2279883.1 hypothetical protein [Francisella philomiragia]MBK2288663.1 hypothetical protein [Francisella philomiragia]MBK2291676.1 hypothetical protein [Francisella philomiragia]
MSFLKKLVIVSLFYIPILSIADNIKFKSIDENYVALDDSGKIWVWGRHMDVIALGYDYNYKNFLKAEPINTKNLEFKKVFSDDEITCGNTIDNDTYCWGGDNHMILGAPKHKKSLIPVKMPISFTQITSSDGLLYSISDKTICALDLSGQAWCWGMGKIGQLGNGEKFSPDTNLTMVNYTNFIQSVPKKVKMPKNIKFIEIAGGKDDSRARFVALDSNGNIWQWGATGSRDANGNGIFFEYPTKRKAPKGVKFTKLFDSRYLLDSSGNIWELEVAGDINNSFHKKTFVNQKVETKENNCLITTTGELWCTYNERKPNYFKVNLPGKAKQLALREATPVGCVLSSDGKINCFYPKTKQSVKLAEFDIPKNLKFKTIITGYSPDYCALSNDGDVWCWCKFGDNSCFGDSNADEKEVLTNIQKEHPYIKPREITKVKIQKV